MIRSSQISDSSATGDLESRYSNFGPSVLSPQTTESECPCIDDPVTQGGKKSTFNCVPMEAPIRIISNIGDQNLGAAAAYGSKTNFLLADQCPHTCCRRRNTQNQSLEMLLEVILLMSSVHAAGAYAFGKMIRIRERDPNSNQRLEAFIALFAASFLCTFLGALILLIIVSRREYYQYKKLCLVISNTAAFVLMMIGYCFVVAFNM